MADIQRRKTLTVTVGGVRVGSNAPVMVQSMTNTDTADIPGTIKQVAALARAGSEVVRVTVNNDDSAKAIPHIVEGLAKQGLRTPIIGDFHYNGHLLLTKYPGCAEGLAKYRINPGNASIGRKGDDNFRTMIEVAVKHQKPVRIGVNWGSLDQALLTKMMDENSLLPEPKDAREVTMEAIVVSALTSAKLAERHGLRPDQIILSAKVSGVQDLIDVYRILASRCEYPLHLGLTEAGMGAKGIVASSAAMAVLLQEGIGDTIRVSLTPAPGGDRTEEVRVAQQILHPADLGAENNLVGPHPVLLRDRGRLQCAHHHRFHHHVARLFRLIQTRILVHHLRQQRLVQRPPVHSNPHRLLVLHRNFNHRPKVVIVLPPNTHVPRINPVLCQRPRTSRILLEQQMPVVVKIADHGGVPAFFF